MLPVGPLMTEHRLIEKVIRLFEKELDNISRNHKANLCFIEVAIDFMEIYADRCHHGKEENILFCELKKKNLSLDLSKILGELINEHVISRKTIAALSSAKDGYLCGDKDSLATIVQSIKVISDLYPKHIEKEDKQFFLPSMKYFSEIELSKMLEEFWDFDRKLIHEKYKSMVLAMEQSNMV